MDANFCFGRFSLSGSRDMNCMTLVAMGVVWLILMLVDGHGELGISFLSGRENAIFEYFSPNSKPKVNLVVY